jgi:hypothetical protein
VTFEFSSPYIIGLHAAQSPAVGHLRRRRKERPRPSREERRARLVSVDRGRTWIDCGPFADGMDLTDHVKGYRQYRLRLGAGAKALAARD